MNNPGNANHPHGRHETRGEHNTDIVPVIADVVFGCDRSVSMALWVAQKAVAQAQGVHAPNDGQTNIITNQGYNGVQEAA